ncbi:MAG: hypothetical protein ACXWSD_06225 [Bdellovibrionota bacterium]
MTFEEFHSAAWNDHATDAAGVSKRLPGALALLVKREQVPLLAKLIVHVDGEHCGNWALGLERLKALADLNLGEAESVERARVVLELAGGKEDAANKLVGSDRIRVLSVAAAALVGQNQIQRGAALFRKAARAAESGLDEKDPAHRELAVAGNNLASVLEERPRRTPEEDALMILAAQTGRRHWEFAGTWVHVARAEYRLAMTHIQAGLADQAAKHAEASLEVLAAHDGGPLDVFFALEALSLAERAKGQLEAFAKHVARGEEVFSRLSADDQAWAKPTLEKLKNLV